MRIIEISRLENGAHRNQNANLETVPEGWAVIPDDMETPNFPFGEIEVEEKDGIMVVTKWTKGEIPTVPKEEEKPTAVEQLRADVDYIAIMMGVEL